MIQATLNLHLCNTVQCARAVVTPYFLIAVTPKYSFTSGQMKPFPTNPNAARLGNKVGDNGGIPNEVTHELTAVQYIF